MYTLKVKYEVNPKKNTDAEAYKKLFELLKNLKRPKGFTNVHLSYELSCLYTSNNKQSAVKIISAEFIKN